MAKLTLNSFIHNLWKTLLIVKNKFHKTFKNFIFNIQNNFYKAMCAHSPNKLALCFQSCLNGCHQVYQQASGCENIKWHSFQQVVNKLTIMLYFNKLRNSNVLITVFTYINNLICKKINENLLYNFHIP